MTYSIPGRETPLALAADDDISLRLSMSAALRKAGFQVVEAESGTEALSLFESEKPDIVLLDVIMPEMDGFETCKAIRRLPDGLYTQILMVTGLDDTDSIKRAFEAGANDFVTKPINWTMLGHRGRYMLRAGRAFQEIHRSRSRLAKIQELAKLGNWQIDLTENTFQCSPEACSLLGLDMAEGPVTYNDFLTTVIAQDRGTVRRRIDAAVESKTSVNLNYSIVLPLGTRKYILNQAEVLYDKNGEAEIMMGVVQDISQLKQAEEEIRLLAFYDGLTGLANRMLFTDRLNHAIAKNRRSKSTFALLFLDLDQFKRINDTLGHHIGDLLLQNVAATLKKSVRQTDTASLYGADPSDSVIARLGGDEFIVLLSDIRKPENAALVADRLLKAIPKTYELDGHEVSVTTSIGISIFPSDGTSAEKLLKCADAAMYHAKSSGRNNYQFYAESMNIAVVERFSIERDLKKAIERDEFRLYYQPQISLSDRKIVGAEALIRWLHPQKGMIAPEKFIRIAEESGTIVDINKWVIQTACRQHNEWFNKGLAPIRIAVNLSCYKIAKQNIIQILKNTLADNSLNGSRIEVEITENVLMQDTADTLLTLKEIKDLSIRIALDDFGTGYSSLSYLNSFQVDVIKIDRSFVMGSTQQKNNRVIIKAIIAMGHSMGLKIIAEGVETKEQFELLKKYGCDEAQGFYFRPPVPHDKFAEILADGVL